MILKEFITTLYTKLQEPLPGKSAHLKLAPYRKSTFDLDLEKFNPKLASTLLLFYQDNLKIKFALIQRPDYSGTHGGQISFPGGKNEEGETLKETALRETFEEIGIPKEKIQVIGELSQVYIPPSNFLISPFIAFMDENPSFIPELKEVKQILEIDLDELLREDVIQEKEMVVGENTGNAMKIKVPYMDLRHHTVWGATGVILSEFRDLII